MAVVAVQVVVVVLRGERLLSAGETTVFEVVLWLVVAVAVPVPLVFVYLSRGRHRETVRLAEMFPGSVVVSTSVNEERREALEAVGVFSRRVRLPVEMRVVMTPTSMTFWRRDLTNPVIKVNAASISYEVGDYVTIAGKFRTLRARVPLGAGTVDVPLFPIFTRKIFPRILPREDLEQMVERIDGMRSAGAGGAETR